MRTKNWLLTLAIIVGALAAPKFSAANVADKLEKNFVHPPDSARPWVYWFWLNGNISREGITADLKAMKRVGIGGVLIMEVDQGTPKGPAAFGKPEWRELFKHVVSEAARLGLEVNMNNDAGWCGSGGPWITPDLAMQKLVWTETNVVGPCHFEAVLAQPLVVSNFYEDIFVFAFPTPAEYRIENILGKAAFVPQPVALRGNWLAISADKIIAQDRIVELTAKLGQDGKLAWNIPDGKWTILRLGHTPTGKDNHPAPEAGRGLETDKLSRRATDLMFDNLMGKLISDSKPLVGKALVSTHIDSWETGSPNWTPKFREEFQRRRGYDPLKFFPVMTGRVVDSLEISERFLWDARMTVNDLLLENYADRFRDLAKKNGIRLSIEGYDATPCDDMTFAGRADEPMAEFWSWGYNTAYSCVEMSSSAHTYGKKILGAEAFTATDGEKWQLHPATIKSLGDWAFCEGINRFVFHRYAMQPWLDRPPGMSMGPWGLHYERTQTWWEQSRAWHEYLARCQSVLQQGLFVADVCYLESENSPNRWMPPVGLRDGNTPDRPKYNFDGCTPEVVYTRMKVRDGRIVLPDGMSYRALVMPPAETMTPKLLRRVKELVASGATLIGPRPLKSPSLNNFPKCDNEVKSLADEIFGKVSLDAAVPELKERRLGKGSVWETPRLTTTEKLPDAAKWIWFKEGNPAQAAPAGKRYFRRVFTLDSVDQIKSAHALVTADNEFQLFINGQRAGTGSDFTHLTPMAVAQYLKPGTNILAVVGINGSSEPNPAALIGAVTILYRDGRRVEIVTDGKWHAAKKAAKGWQSDLAATKDWSKAMELGPSGMAPWNLSPIAQITDIPEVAQVLEQLNVQPDFTSDATLRYIHKKIGDTDVYFVANGGESWVEPNCTFRVSGKLPELWNPVTGEIQRQVLSREKDGRTTLRLRLEPSGSVFVVFREANRAKLAQAKADAVTMIVKDGKKLWPQTTRAATAWPLVELADSPSGEMDFAIWQCGNYEIKTVAGEKTANVADVPKPIEISGAWNLQFAPRNGAAQNVSLPKLISWSEHADAAVKYFSGTATYQKTFTVASEMISPQRRWFLDLGKVAVMAEVKVNGKDFGILWKPPYRADVTEALRAGENSLEIKVVNLWINRMIGDEFLAEDSDRNPNGTLKSWPQFVQENKASPTGRETFTSWKLWKKDSPLQESGLLGPVRLVANHTLRIQK